MPQNSFKLKMAYETSSTFQHNNNNEDYNIISNNIISNNNNNISSNNTCNTNKKLVDEIEDGFLLCPLCTNAFKRPKILSCLHTFCSRCLGDSHDEEISQRKYYDPRDVTCPLCRKKTPLSHGGIRTLPDNHLVMSLSEVVTKQKNEIKKQEDEPMCEVCRQDDDEEFSKKAKLDDNSGCYGNDGICCKYFADDPNVNCHENEKDDEHSMNENEKDGEHSMNGIKMESNNSDHAYKNKPHNSNNTTTDNKKSKTTSTFNDKNDSKTTKNFDSGKRRKSFMSNGLVLRSSFYDEEIKQRTIDEESTQASKSSTADETLPNKTFTSRKSIHAIENGTSESSRSSGVGSSTVSSSNESSQRNTQSVDEKEVANKKSFMPNSQNKLRKERGDEDRRAVSKCLECNKMLCKGCVRRHQDMKVTGSHCLIDVETEKDVQCKEHPGEAVRFFCEPCMECVCVLCAFNKHREHNVETFADSANRQREALINVITDCREKTGKLEEKVELMKGLEDNFKRVEAEVREKATEAVMKIRAEERDLINRVHEQLGASFIEYLDNKEHLNLQLETMQNTCNLAEMIVASKDVEMLLLKREVEEKLSILSRVPFNSSPVLPKSFVFLPGSVHLGSIQDHA